MCKFKRFGGGPFLSFRGWGPEPPSHGPAYNTFSALSILTILFDKCQTKSYFKDMNILVKAILKFCTTNQLFELR